MGYLTKKTVEGAKRSARDRNAKTNVPIMKPNCTEEVSILRADSGRLNVLISSFIMPFPANHNEVQKNCAVTIIGSIH